MEPLIESCVAEFAPLSNTSPVIVGGIGGSGTRLVADILLKCGFFIGDDLNSSMDDLRFTALFKRGKLWPIIEHCDECLLALEVYLTSRGQHYSTSAGNGGHLSRVDMLAKQITSENAWVESDSLALRWKALAKIEERKRRWGWKEPNSHIFSAFLLQALPNARFIFVTRDGRDMAFSRNQAQLKVWGPHLLKRRVDVDNPADALDYWMAVHARMLAIRGIAPSRVLILKFESLFFDKVSTRNKLVDFLGDVEEKKIKDLLNALRPPASIGRHKTHEKINLKRAQTQMLREYGYP